MLIHSHHPHFTAETSFGFYFCKKKKKKSDLFVLVPIFSIVIFCFSGYISFDRRVDARIRETSSIQRVSVPKPRLLQPPAVYRAHQDKWIFRARTARRFPLNIYLYICVYTRIKNEIKTGFPARYVFQTRFMLEQELPVTSLSRAHRRVNFPCRGNKLMGYLSPHGCEKITEKFDISCISLPATFVRPTSRAT